MLCPVCGDIIVVDEKWRENGNCTRCGFEEVDEFFLNEEQAHFWLEHSVKPYRENWKKEEALKRQEAAAELDRKRLEAENAALREAAIEKRRLVDCLAKVLTTANSRNHAGELFIENRKKHGETVAREILHEAVEHGNATAQYNLGVMYGSGHGVAQDNAEAVKWFHKAAEQGHHEAQHRLGLAYQLGIGVAKDVTKSIEWHRKADSGS
ncbi:hypothetical protein FACS1894216_13590 [Synergistales bacterium]|nr:hypothetical protein FACS1894216_13590 [Synergistales bacterium]